MPTVLLVDDHDLIRQGLRRAFERESDFTVVGEASTVVDCLLLAAELTPDVAVVDINLLDGNGLDAVVELRATQPAMGIVVLTMYDDDDHLFRAMEAGASAFVPKSVSTDLVLAAARHAASSPLSFSATDLAEAVRRRLSPIGPRLSGREAELLALLSEGLSIAAVAQRMFISESTVKTHVSKLYEKLGATNRAQALMTAVRLGLISSSDV